MVYISGPIPSLTVENGKVKTHRKIGFTNDMKGIKKRLSFPQSFLSDKLTARLFTSKSLTSRELEHRFHDAFNKYHHIAMSNVRELYDVNNDQIDEVVAHLKDTSIPDLEEIHLTW